MTRVLGIRKTTAMQLMEITLPTAADNLALDEALLLGAEARDVPGEVFRTWELTEPCVVIGRGSQVDAEVDCGACAAAGVEIFRRCSGGAAVVLGPGCLVYSLILSYRLRPELRMLDQAHAFVLGKITQGLATINAQVDQAGISDLVVPRGPLGRTCKISGNSLRCRRDYFLYHGTLLCKFDLSCVSRWLRLPPRQPSYRDGRAHEDFVANLGVSTAVAKRGLRAAWANPRARAQIPHALVAQLVRDKYDRREWNLEGRVTKTPTPVRPQ